VRIVYSERYAVDIGAHVFPIGKYDRVRSRLASGPAWPHLEFVDPEPASWEDLALVHTPGYLEKLRHGRLSIAEQAEVELAWSPDVVEVFRLMVGGTLIAARLAARTLGGASAGAAVPPGDRTVVHLGGGFHHAFPDHGEGFCLFNDVAVAIRVLVREAGLARAAIIDCDVHHGNGTATIFAGDPSVFTFSIHQLHNYPATKPRGSLDVGLADAAADGEYLHALRRALPRVFEADPEMVFYLAGADPFEGDQLGGLSLTQEGLRQRDRAVLEAVADAGLPVVVTLAGGYARHVEDTVSIHVATVEEALAVARRTAFEIR